MKNLINSYKLKNFECINKYIKGENEVELVEFCEKTHEKRIDEIYKQILDKGARVILVTGPSSSGKTTLSRLLADRFEIPPIVLSVDNFFYGKTEIDKSTNSYEQYETIAAVNTELFNKCICSLLDGKNTPIPRFDFSNDTSIKEDRWVTLLPGQEIIIEGTHAFNNQLLSDVDDSEKFKLFIYLGTDIEINNRIITKRQLRLVRRAVRDSLYRGCPYSRTQKLWEGVIRFENENIMAYKDEADAVFNSFLPYEPCVMHSILRDLIKNDKLETDVYDIEGILFSLSNYLSIDKSYVPDNSILSEFI